METDTWTQVRPKGARGAAPPKGNTTCVYLGRPLALKLHAFAMQHNLTKGVIIRMALTRFMADVAKEGFREG